MFLKIITVAALASFEVYAAIPAAFAFELPYIAVLASTIFGGIAGVFVTAFLGGKIREFFMRLKKQKTQTEKPRNGIVYKIWNRYGIIGLGVLGTMTVGAPISIAVGIGFKAPLRMLIIWCSIGVIARCAIFTTVGYYGMRLI